MVEVVAEVVVPELLQNDIFLQGLVFQYRSANGNRQHAFPSGESLCSMHGTLVQQHTKHNTLRQYSAYWVEAALEAEAHLLNTSPSQHRQLHMMWKVLG